MRILIVGNGGREHALAWQVAKSERVSQVFCAPGNAGTANEPGVESVDIGATDIPALMAFAEEKEVDLTIVGPEAPLVAGIVDQFMARGLKCFGPTAAAAQLEGSKAFTKEFLARHDIPTAAYGIFEDMVSAAEYLETASFPVVIKADGLAAGKGVIICENLKVARETADGMLSQTSFGSAGQRIVIEEFLRGEEASFIVMVDGKNILPMASSQDHKARDAGDEGPNTGGMGAYSPAPVVNEMMHQRIMDQVIRPTVAGMASDGTAFTGFLYAGVMIGDDGIPKVLEFNVRFGDPETQPIMMRLRSDLSTLCLAALDGKLDQCDPKWSNEVALGVVLAAEGYPEDYATGLAISGLASTNDKKTKIFHAGTRISNGEVITSGGRVLCVCALGEDIREAQERSYRAVGQISWPGMFFRPDIGYRALARL